MKSTVFMRGLITLVTVFTLSACTGNEEPAPEKKQDQEMKSSSGEHKEMDHSGSGEIPEQLDTAENPKYEVGSKAIITSGHMKGMKGAKATIAGAFDTVVYSVSYTPVNGGERVENHKWVIHEEIEEAGEIPLEPGTEVTLDASHMKGMDGTTATIESAKETTVYMVDYMPTTGGEKVTNHKWVIESELSPVK